MEASIKATLPLSMAFPFFLRDVDVLLRAEKDEPVLSWLNRQGLQHSDQAERMRAMVWRKSIQNGCAKSIHRWARHHVPVELESWMEGVRLKPSEYLSSPNGWVGLNQTGLQLSLNDDNVMSILERWTDDARQGGGGCSDLSTKRAIPRQSGERSDQSKSHGGFCFALRVEYAPRYRLVEPRSFPRKLRVGVAGQGAESVA